MNINTITQKLPEYSLLQFTENQLVREIIGALSLVKKYKHRARTYYFDVLFSIYKCPACGGQLKMTEENCCSCSCGNVFDPTLAFQKSACCRAGLMRKTFHYVCLKCLKTVPSHFLFDERVFDKAYFQEMMRQSRKRKKIKREEMKRLLAESRSDILTFTESPDIETIPGLIEDLDKFVQNMQNESSQDYLYSHEQFDMDKYRDHILSMLSWHNMLFSEIEPLYPDIRDDKVYRFITLVFMDHEHEVRLNQSGDDLSIQRLYNEAYA